MTKQIKKIFCVLLCLSMIFALSGCGDERSSGVMLDFEDEESIVTSSDEAENNDSNSSQADSNTNSNSSTNSKNETVSKVEGTDGTSDPFANVPARLKGTTVKFAHFGDEGSAEYEKVIKAFTKKTGIKVKLIAYDQTEYMGTVSKQIAAKSSPDVVICNEIFPHGLEIAQPIQKYIDLSDPFWKDPVTEVCTINGNTYFVNSLKGPWHNVDMVFYNTKIFADTNSPKDYYEQGKWTYENLRKCMEYASKLGNQGGYVDPKMMCASMGAPLISYSSKTGTFAQNLTAATSAFEYCSLNVKDKLWNPILWHANFGNGTVGLYMHSSYGCKYNGWFKDGVKSSIDAVPMPSSYKGVACKTSESIRAYGIAKGATNPEGAAYFLRYFLDYSYYESAGAKCFLNDNLKKAYFDVMEKVSKEGINYYFNEPIYDYTTCTADDLKFVVKEEPANVGTKLASFTNEFNAGISKLNEKIKSVG